MKHVLIFFSQSLLLFMIGCGDSSAPPPQPPGLKLNNPTDQAQLQTMFTLAQQTKEECGKSGANSLAPVMMMMSNPQAGMGGGLPVIPSLGGQCSDNLINFIMMYSTMSNGQYANYPETRPWFISQLGGIVSRVGSNLVARGFEITSDRAQKLQQAGWQLVQRDVLTQPSLQPVRPAFCTGAVQFGLGC